MSQYLDEYEVAEALEASVEDVIELIEYGVIPARRDAEGWAIAHRDLKKFRWEWGTDVESALSHAMKSERSDRTSGDPVGQFIGSVLKIALGIILALWLISKLFYVEVTMTLQ